MAFSSGGEGSKRLVDWSQGLVKDPQTLPVPPAFTEEPQPNSQVPDPDLRAAVFGTHLFVQDSFLWPGYITTT